MYAIPMNMPSESSDDMQWTVTSKPPVLVRPPTPHDATKPCLDPNVLILIQFPNLSNRPLTPWVIGLVLLSSWTRVHFLFSFFT